MPQTLFFTSSVGSSGTLLPIQCDTPELIDFLTSLSLDQIEKKLIYNANPIKKSQHGVVNLVSLFLPTKNITQKLVKKQGNSDVQREIMITTAIRTNTVTNFPIDSFSLPIYQLSNGITHIYFTNYRELGDLETSVSRIQEKIQFSDDSVFDYLFYIFLQLIIALEALHNCKFKDKKGTLHQGIVHNDIKPDNIFLKENGGIELADFGCSYFKDSIAPQLATFWFSAPELWSNSDFCKNPIENIEKSDIWSLGATMMYTLKNKKLITPSEKKSDSEFDKVQNYTEWAKNYDQQWIAQVITLGIASSEDLQAMINQLQNKIKPDWLDASDINQKKILLETLAVLMLAPFKVRPDAKKLKKIMGTLGFIFKEEPRNFVSQFFECKYSHNTRNLKTTNGYISILDLNTEKPNLFKR